MDYQILLYYKYVEIKNDKEFLKEHQQLCESLNLKGRIIISREGINGTIEGTKENTKKYIKALTLDERFKDIHFKKSVGTGKAFTKLNIKVREEIVALHLDKTQKPINPLQITGKYLKPKELHKWIHSNKRFFIVDVRNDYEAEIGYFENSIKAPFSNFRDLPKVLPVLESLKGEIIVTVCTGGVRCEKASGFLVVNGFKNVYQLYGGIISYMEKYPNEDFLGKLYVFDGRITMGFNIDDPQHIVVAKCSVCGKPADNYYDCKNIYCQSIRHFISCDKCISQSKGYCSSC